MINKLKLILLFIFIIGCTGETVEKAIVARVIDGDTVELDNGKHVRFICMNTPEKNEPGHDEATDFLKSLVLNKSVNLVKDTSDTDKYGRLLRYVYLDDLFVNSKIVEEGYAKILRIEPNTKLCSEIEKAEAKSKNLGFFENKSQPLDCNSLGCNESVAVGSKKSTVWHYCNCKWAGKIKKENRICFKTTKEAEEKGYKETKVC